MKLIIDIPEDEYKRMTEDSMFRTHIMIDAIQNGIPLDSVKAEIKEKCDNINYVISDLPYPKHRFVQELLCEILTSIDNAESIDPNDLTHIFDGVTEFPKDAFKGWDTEELLKQIRAESEDKE